MNDGIITVHDTAPAISDDTIIQLAENAEKRIEAIKKIKEISLKVTNVNDWIDQQGRPYLQASGSTKVARVFGVSWRIDEPVYEEFEDGHFQYTFKGEFSLAGSTIESLGVRSSKDGFFTTRYKEGKKIQLTGAEVDKGDVKKAALTNLLGNGVTTILGIRNMTWGEIAETMGFGKDDVTNIQYGDKKKGNNKPPLKPPQKSTGRGQTSTSVKDNKKDIPEEEHGTYVVDIPESDQQQHDRELRHKLKEYAKISAKNKDNKYFEILDWHDAKSAEDVITYPLEAQQAVLHDLATEFKMKL